MQELAEAPHVMGPHAYSQTCLQIRILSNHSSRQGNPRHSVGGNEAVVQRPLKERKDVSCEVDLLLVVLQDQATSYTERLCCGRTTNHTNIFESSQIYKQVRQPPPLFIRTTEGHEGRRDDD